MRGGGIVRWVFYYFLVFWTKGGGLRKKGGFGVGFYFEKCFIMGI
jgi:hypothetical protein